MEERENDTRGALGEGYPFKLSLTIHCREVSTMWLFEICSSRISYRRGYSTGKCLCIFLLHGFIVFSSFSSGMHPSRFSTSFLLCRMSLLLFCSLTGTLCTPLSKYLKCSPLIITVFNFSHYKSYC